MFDQLKKIEWKKSVLSIEQGEKILFAALLLICLVPFSHRPGWLLFGKPVSLLLFMALGLLLWGLALSEWRKYKSWPPFVTLSAVFILSLFVSAFLAKANPPDAIKTSFGVLLRGMGPALFAFVLVAFHNRGDRLYGFLMIVGAVVAVGAIFEVLTGHYFFFSRTSPEIDWHRHYPPEKGFAVGAVGQPLPFSSLMTLLFPFSFVRAVKTKQRVAIISAVLMFAAIFLAYRRSGYFLAGLTIAWGLFQMKDKKKMLKLVLGGLLFFIILNLVSPTIRGNVVSRFNVNVTIQELRHSHRTQSFGTVGRILKDHFLFGFGTRQYPNLHQWYEPIMNAYETPDNQYLRFLAEGGIVGLLAFLGWLLYGFFMAFRLRSPEAWAFRLALFNFSFSMLLIDAFYWPALQMTLWVVMGLTAGLYYETNRQ